MLAAGCASPLPLKYFHLKSAHCIRQRRNNMDLPYKKENLMFECHVPHSFGDGAET